MTRFFYLICIMSLISACTTLETPEIKGIVLDHETGKPLEGAYVIVRWSKTYSGPGGHFGGKDFKELRLKTDSNGSFIIPSYKVINWTPYPFGQGGNFAMAIFTHGYKVKKFVFHESQEFLRSKYSEFNERKEDGTILFKLEEIKDPDTFYKNDDEIYGLFEKDLNYLITEYQIFIEKFPKDKHVPGYLLSIGSMYEEKGDYEKALNAYREILENFPESSTVDEANRRIKKLEKRL